MEIVPIVGIVFALVVILILAYLYRESAIMEGKTEIAIGPVKFHLGGKAPGSDTSENPAAPPPGAGENMDESKINPVEGVQVNDNASDRP